MCLGVGRTVDVDVKVKGKWKKKRDGASSVGRGTDEALTEAEALCSLLRETGQDAELRHSIRSVS